MSLNSMGGLVKNRLHTKKRRKTPGVKNETSWPTEDKF